MTFILVLMISVLLLSCTTLFLNYKEKNKTRIKKNKQSWFKFSKKYSYFSKKSVSHGDRIDFCFEIGD